MCHSELKAYLQSLPDWQAQCQEGPHGQLLLCTFEAARLLSHSLDHGLHETEPPPTGSLLCRNLKRSLSSNRVPGRDHPSSPSFCVRGSDFLGLAKGPLHPLRTRVCSRVHVSVGCRQILAWKYQWILPNNNIFIALEPLKNYYTRVIRCAPWHFS